MNKFAIFSCIRVKEEDYSGHCLVMNCVNDPAFMLFFPISEENSKVISYVLDGNDDYSVDTNILGIYKTMIDSWKSSDRYLSGVIMDSVYDQEYDTDVLMIKLALADCRGNLDSLVRVNFLHAVLIAAMEKTSVLVSDELIAQMMPPEDEEKDDIFSVGSGENDFEDFEDDTTDKSGKEYSSMPEDKNIVDIARKIMSGKIKDKEDEEDNDNEV